MRRQTELLRRKKSLSHTWIVTTMSLHTMSVIFIDWHKEPASEWLSSTDGGALASDLSFLRRLSRRSATESASEKGETWQPGWGWFHGNTRQGARPDYSASASSETSI